MERVISSNVILRWIWNQWDQVNKSEILGRLSPPVFQVHSGSSRLGYWQQKSRIMSFSEQLLKDGTEYEFELVLKHEMAHQVSDEILKAEGETPHGDAFGYACKMLGIHQCSKLKWPSKENKVAVKIKKLLQLALSSNPHEAQLAASRAQQLMEKYQVTDEESHYIFHHLARFGSRRRAADRSLISLLNRHFSIYSIWIQSPKIGNDGLSNGSERGLAATYSNGHISGRAWHIEIMGLRHHVEIASYTFEYLSREMEQQWRDFRKKTRSKSGDKRSFQLGLLAGLDKRLSGDRSNTKEAGSLVQLHSTELISFVETRYPKLSRRKTRGSTLSNRYHDGFQQGMNLNIHDGIQSGDKPLGLPK